MERAGHWIQASLVVICCVAFLRGPLWEQLQLSDFRSQRAKNAHLELKPHVLGSREESGSEGTYWWISTQEAQVGFLGSIEGKIYGRLIFQLVNSNCGLERNVSITTRSQKMIVVVKNNQRVNVEVALEVIDGDVKGGEITVTGTPCFASGNSRPLYVYILNPRFTLE